MVADEIDPKSGIIRPRCAMDFVAIAARSAMRVRPLYTECHSADIDAALRMAASCCKGDFPERFSEDAIRIIVDSADSASKEALASHKYPSAFSSLAAASAAEAALVATHMYKVAGSEKEFNQIYGHNGAGFAYEQACKASFMVPPSAGKSLHMAANAIASFYNDVSGDPFDRIREITNAEIRNLSKIKKKKIGNINGFDLAVLDPTPKGPLGEVWLEYPEWWTLNDSDVGRHSLAIMVLDTGELRVELVERFGRLPVLDNDSGVVAQQGILLPSAFLSEELKEFDRLLNTNPPVREEVFQEFFESNPKWLYLLGEQYENVVPQIKLPKLEVRETLAFIDGESGDNDYFPDFMLKRIGLDLWDILDLKRHSFKTVVGGNSRRKFGEAVHEAVAQLREYTARLQQNEVREYLAKKFGVTVVKPVSMIVIGRDFEFRTPREKDVLRVSDGVRVYTYDDLRRLAANRCIQL